MKREIETYTYWPCFHCGYQMPPRVYKKPGDGLNQHCPKCLAKGDENGMCDVKDVKYSFVDEEKGKE